MHKTSTREFILKKAKSLGFVGEVLAEMKVCHSGFIKGNFVCSNPLAGCHSTHCRRRWRFTSQNRSTSKWTSFASQGPPRGPACLLQKRPLDGALKNAGVGRIYSCGRLSLRCLRGYFCSRDCALARAEQLFLTYSREYSFYFQYHFRCVNSCLVGVKLVPS